MNRPEVDALVIGAGPAGAAVAIGLAKSGWRIALIETATYPRQKVCGECLNPASLQLLDALGVGQMIGASAGPELRRVAWTTRKRTLYAAMPACRWGPYRYGRAIGRDILDTLLLERARSLGVKVVQPARVSRIAGVPGQFQCTYQLRGEGSTMDSSIVTSMVIDAHGSWQRQPDDLGRGGGHEHRRPARPSDLLAFKATFREALLPSGVLPVLAMPGGYGGMVEADGGRVTLACCVRRDVLRQRRRTAPGAAVGVIIEQYLRDSCQAVRAALRHAQRESPWQSAGPLRPGFHEAPSSDLVRIGNAAVEAHPLIGEGICMALQSAAHLAHLLGAPPRALDRGYIREVQRAHVKICRADFSARVRVARIYAAIAMRPSLSAQAGLLLHSWPGLLTLAAQLAGKARGAMAYPEK